MNVSNVGRLSRVLLLTIVAVYVAIGVLYATFTPTWQVPDEPAHYNYVRALVEGRGLPVIEPGDYDQAYLSRLTSERFPPELSIEPLEYEDHQPPLYYLLAAPVYVLFDGQVLPLRLLSVLFGAALLVVAFGTVQAVFPARPEMPLMVAAFIAFIPQHVAMTAGVNNDTLAELVVGGTLWALVTGRSRRRRRLQTVGRTVPTADGRGQTVGNGRTINVRNVRNDGGHQRRPWAVGLLLAVALLTKTTAYVSVVLAAVTVLIRWQREGQTWKWAAGQLAWMLVPAFLLSAPWFIRNGLVYGWQHPLGLARHNEIVEGQLRTAEYVAQHGWGTWLNRLFRWTFRSFWGQFGWMGVVLPARIYQALALLSVSLGAGFLWWLFSPRRPRLTASQRGNLIVLLTSCLLTTLSFLWYNATFVQHQGRYLFPALIAIGTAAALGLNTLVGILPRRVRPWAVAAFFTGLAGLDVLCLFRYIIPALMK